MELPFDKIKAFPAVTLLQLINGVLVPGYLFIYIFKRNEFFSLDIFRLSTLAISISTPILTINSLFILGIYSASKPEVKLTETAWHKGFSTSIYIGSFICTIVLYLSIAIGYFLRFTFHQSIITLLLTEIISFILIATIFNAVSKK